ITDGNGCRRPSEPYRYGRQTVTAAAGVAVMPELTEAEAGQIVTIPILLQSSEQLAESGASAVEGAVRFDRSMLLPLGETSTVEGEERVVRVRGRLRPGNDTLVSLRCVVLLGRQEYTPLDIEAFEWRDAGVEVSRRSGVFHLTGICQTGDQRL